MRLPLILLALSLLQIALSTADDAFEHFATFNPEEDSDIETYLDRQSRSGGDKFLRFGKAFWDYDSGSDSPFDDREVVQRPLRTGSLSENPPQRTVRDKSSFLRFGRSVNEETKKKRGKREATSSSEALKRHENYLRFGRNSNSNFMRFGRNLGLPSESLADPMEHNLDVQNRDLLNYLRHLLRQSEENFRHKNGI